MHDWRQRMEFCCGTVEKAGKAGLEQMITRYHDTTDERLARIAERYGATHAVLYAEADTAFEILASNPTYKVVTIKAPRWHPLSRS